jgi:hypothetical protein
MAEFKTGGRKALGSPEVEWALEYERSLLPSDGRYPMSGDVYDPLQPCRVEYMTQWSAPVTGGGHYMLQPGEHIRAEFSSAEPRPVLVNALPVSYEATERKVVPLWTRLRPGYGGFHFAVSTSDLMSKFRLVSPGT